MDERKIIQVGIVVEDMDRALKQYSEVFNAGPWDIYEFGPPEMRESTYYGKHSEWSALLALTWVGDRHVELIKPMKGPNIYFDFIEKHGYGIHHIKEWIPAGISIYRYFIHQVFKLVILVFKGL